MSLVAELRPPVSARHGRLSIPRRAAAACLAALCAWLAAPAAAQSGRDVKGASDHWLFTRMPGTYIGEYARSDFDAYVFSRAPESPRIEGRLTTIRYWTKPGAAPATALEICRNHAGAIAAAGGTVVQESGNFVTMKIEKDGGETWAEVACDNGRYALVVVERRAMVQAVSAGEMKRAIDAQGFVALDIRFDTGKATIKPESRPIVDQIVLLMKGDPALRVSVEGHTDDVGAPASNRTLSEARASAVADAIARSGIDRSRLSAAGYGQERPVADNRTEEGRAKNRRVEIAKR